MNANIATTATVIMAVQDASTKMKLKQKAGNRKAVILSIFQLWGKGGTSRLFK